MDLATISFPTTLLMCNEVVFTVGRGDWHDGELCLTVDTIFAVQRSLPSEARGRKCFRQIKLEIAAASRFVHVPFLLGWAFFIETVYVEQGSLAVGRDHYRGC